MKDTDKIFCSIILDVLQKKGVKDVVCSPGSRNAPLLIAAASRPELRKHVVTDERSGAFMALGISTVSRQPVALICTSGTALLNYGPAVAEAFYQGVPLVVLSADRPMQWIDQDDSQTLRQFEAFSNYIKKSYEIPAFGEEEKELQWYANRIANDAMIEATSGRPGPVHINIQLAEPLGRKREQTQEKPRIIEILEADSFGNKEIIRDLGKKFADSKVLMVFGFMPPDAGMQKAVAEISRLGNVTIMAETLSNLHLDGEANMLDSVLTAYNEDTLDKMAPDLIISCGGSLVSRKLKEYLRRNSHRCEHWLLGKYHTTVDCFMSMTLRIDADPVRFLRGLGSVARKFKTKENSNYKDRWSHLRKEAMVLKDSFVEKASWSELKAFNLILNSLNHDVNLFLSNGTAVRYAQIINYRLPHASYCNRGVSGIDGSVSTAIGGAKAYGGPTLLITGDLSLKYDIGALALSNIPDRMKIIMIDNQGGGIFRFIPSTSELEEREEYFCVNENFPLKGVAESFEWKYFEAKEEKSLKNNLKEFLTYKGKAILKVVCPPIESADILKNYMKLKI